MYDLFATKRKYWKTNKKVKNAQIHAESFNNNDFGLINTAKVWYFKENLSTNYHTRYLHSALILCILKTHKQNRS